VALVWVPAYLENFIRLCLVVLLRVTKKEKKKGLILGRRNAPSCFILGEKINKNSLWLVSVSYIFFSNPIFSLLALLLAEKISCDVSFARSDCSSDTIVKAHTFPFTPLIRTRLVREIGIVIEPLRVVLG
jgi:hypothetical protein